MKADDIGVVFGILVVASLLTVAGIDIHEDLTTVDTRVETVDGKTYDCTEAYSKNDGMTYIRKPHYTQIPTRYIKLIKRIKP